jgi:DNA-binding MarR family transcriptional regulator
MVPHKIGMPRQALSLSLTHRQRMMYFLINGQRTIADLSRTSGKTVSEVEEVLQELQYHGLIQIFPFSS